jgi:hypothetical protein
MPQPSPPLTVLRLRIELNGVQPLVWRELLVPGGVKLATLHAMFQAVLGWGDAHLHAFQIGESSYGTQDEEEDYPDDEMDEEWVTVLHAVGDHREFTYTYDFGDGWDHRVVVEELLPQRAALKFAVCLAGANACPPDDVGGPSGYTFFLAAMADTDHERHAYSFEWIGGPFDPTEFNLGAANIALQKLR